MRPSVRTVVGVIAILLIVLPILGPTFGPPARAQNVGFDPPKLHPVVERLDDLLAVPVAGWRFHGDLPHGESTLLSDANWAAADPDKHFSSRGWFRSSFELPAKSKGGYTLAGCRVWLDLKIDGQGDVPLAVFVDGLERYQWWDAIGAEPILLTERARPGQRFLIAARTMPGRRERQPNLDTWLVTAKLIFERPPDRPDPRVIARELSAASELASAFPDRRALHEKVVRESVAAIDWKALAAGDEASFDRSLRRAHEHLAPLAGWLGGLSVGMVGNSHMDLAWLWPWTETVEVVRNTFATALQLMREYPELRYAQSSAQYYEWMEEKYPGLFAQIKERVRDGRWEVVGGAWVESDLNMPDGESLVRQLLYGKRFFKEKLGVDVTVGWSPDSFGYTRQLPQILRRAGIDSFITQKLDWNDTTPPPHRAFWWEAPDGSRVLAYLPHKYDNPVDPLAIAHDLAARAPARKASEILYLFGVGDHGGGPTREMLDVARDWSRPGVVFPKLEPTTVRAFLDRVRRHAATSPLPVWKDELYLQYHRGVFTTQAATKQANRRAEDLLAAAETFSSLAWLRGAPYPTEPLRAAWKKVLVNQFHDILPGSGMPAIYKDAARDHTDAMRAAHEALGAALAHLSGQIATAGPGIPVIVFNSLGWPQGGLVTTDLPWALSAAAVEVRDAAGRAVPAQVLPAADGRPATIRFLAAAPAIGYEVYRLVAAEHAPAAPAATSLVTRPEALTIENEALRVRADPKTGCVLLHDKRAARDVFPDSVCGNQLQAFGDRPKAFDAWNIDADFEGQRQDIAPPSSVKVIETGPVRASLRVVTRWRNSTIQQDFVLVPGATRVDVETQIDWHEQHTLLKVAFPLGAAADRATYDVPFGTIERPSRPRTPEEKAKFEVPALRWADLSGPSSGLGVLNDSKYGYDAKDGVLRLTLLRGPVDPDPHADQGLHRFIYSLYPHAGDWKQASLMQRGYELNRPLVAVATTSHDGPLPARQSFIKLATHAGLALSSIKRAEDDAPGAGGRALIVRLFEFAGRAGEATLELPAAPTRGDETSLLEKPERPLTIRGRTVVVPIKPYEIKTVRILTQTRGGP